MILTALLSSFIVLTNPVGNKVYIASDGFVSVAPASGQHALARSEIVTTGGTLAVRETPEEIVEKVEAAQKEDEAKE
jgi:hypothetical protein